MAEEQTPGPVGEPAPEKYSPPCMDCGKPGTVVAAPDGPYSASYCPACYDRAIRRRRSQPLNYLILLLAVAALVILVVKRCG